jgi:hypothetical protein
MRLESVDKVVVKVNPRGISQEYHYGALDRDYNAALNILTLGLSELGQPAASVERVPLRGVVSSEVITGQVFARKQEAPCVSGGSSPQQLP